MQKVITMLDAPWGIGRCLSQGKIVRIRHYRVTWALTVTRECSLVWYNYLQSEPREATRPSWPCAHLDWGYWSALKLKKCFFLQDEVEYLGRRIKPGTLTVYLETKCGTVARELFIFLSSHLACCKPLPPFLDYKLFDVFWLGDNGWLWVF